MIGFMVTAAFGELAKVCGMVLNAWTKRMGLHSGFVLSTMLLGASVCSAGPITYKVDQTIGAGSVTGTIQTNGATGVLSVGDITAWNLELNGVGASFNLTNPTSSVFVVGSDVTGTTKDLFFNFSGTDGGYFLFQLVPFSGSQYYCDQALGGGPCIQGASVVPQFYTDASAQIVPETGNQIIGTAIPEPAALSLVGLSLVGIGFARWRKAR